MEAGFTIWTFQGRKGYTQQKEKLWAVAWRPHPPSLLTDRRQKDIRTNIKQYSKKYDALDDQARDLVRKQFQEERRTMRDAFNSILDRLADWNADREEENGWQEAMEEIMADAEWEEN